MKKNKGFTLIELLAIIVILAIIAVITVPIILNIIENSRKGAAQDSAYGFKDSVDKWYVSELSKPNNRNFSLASSYTVTDGKLNGSIEIPLSGEKPTSGYLNYSNNILTSGCLVFGDYAVTFTNGEVSSTVKGTCNNTPTETVLYYTYDATATANALGYQNSAKVPEIDPSWKYYIKETTQEGVTSYVVRIEMGDVVINGLAFDTSEECTAFITENAVYLDGTGAECVELDNKVTYEIYGVENEDVFVLKPNDYTNNYNTLDDIFDIETEACTVSDSEVNCNGSSVNAISTSVLGEVLVKYGTGGCFANGTGAGCSAQ